MLESVLGSGTTAAVAHKMGRRWIGIEMGELDADVHFADLAAFIWMRETGTALDALAPARLAAAGVSFKHLPHAVPR